jgi:predicted metal-dependent peptidase
MPSRNRSRAGKSPTARDIATENYEAGHDLVAAHPMLGILLHSAWVIREKRSRCPEDGWAVVTSSGRIYVHPTRRGSPEEWEYVLAHCLLHLGFNHFQNTAFPDVWNTACDCYLAGFLARLKFGRPPEEMLVSGETPAGSEQRIYDQLHERGIRPELVAPGTAGKHPDLIFDLAGEPLKKNSERWAQIMGEALVRAVTSSVEVAAGIRPALGGSARKPRTLAQQARSWFISSYPLLGALAASFTLIEDPLLCTRMGISVAAVHAESKEIYVNPNAGLNQQQYRFVLAHELLHVGLRHETVYDRIVTDMRRYRKLHTLRGVDSGDILDSAEVEWWTLQKGADLDAFYRRALCQGLEYHFEQGRGFLPGGLVEEIRALDQPPIPWDVELAQWFDHHFPLPEKMRSYARPHRHQSATPDIPRPSWVLPPNWEDGRTFGVLLDTSGSMDRVALAKALGAIASYSIAREVPAVRLVFCDAATYDEGYVSPEDIAGRVRVRGRGGTILQPGVNLLEHAPDFPHDGPLLIITDGLCDVLHIRREHAFLLPQGRHLPFVAKGEVFYIS